MHSLLWVIAALCCGAYICGPIVDPDLWWHITVGKWIIANKEIPAVDHWNLYAQGMPWRAYSWSNEVLFAAADLAGGAHGLLTLKLIYAFALSLALFWSFSRLANDGFMGALLGIVSTLACFNHFTLRPQSLVWIFFVWVLHLSENISTKGMTRTRLLLLALVMMFWANTHLTTALGLFLAVCWTNPELNFRKALVVGCICVLGTLITPYFGGEWLTFFSKTGHPLQLSSITEFKPATIFDYSTGFLSISVFLLAIFVHYRPGLIAPVKLMCAVCFVIAGLAVTKFIPFAVILLSALTAICWSKVGEDKLSLGNLGDAILRLRNFTLSLSGQGLAFLLICVFVVNVQKHWRSPISMTVVPVLAVDFIQRHQLEHPILNTFGNGGYLIYRFSDDSGNLEHKVPIDGRTNVMTHETWSNFSAAFFGRQQWKKYIEQVRPRTILWRRESPFSSILLSHSEWCEVFVTGTQDDGYNVFVARDFFEARRDTLKSANCSPGGQSEEPPRTENYL